MQNLNLTAPKYLTLTSPSGFAGAVVDPNVSGTAENFTVTFPKLSFPPTTEVAIQSVSFTISYYNITTANNTIGYRTSAGGATITKTIPPGNYALADINTFLQAAMHSDGNTGTDSNGNTVYYITLGVNLNTIKTTVTLSNGYALDLTVGNLWQNLGFTSGVLITTQGITTATSFLNIAPINSLLLHTDLVNGTYVNATQSNVIHNIVPTSGPGYQQTSIPYHPVFLPVAKMNFNQMTFYMTDQSNNSISLNGQPMTITLEFRY